jgi:Tfp pilus assembly PilM family ATPase
LLSKLQEFLRSSISTAGPSVGVEIAADSVTGAALSWANSTPKLTSHVRIDLPDGAVKPTATATNLIERDVVVDAVHEVLRQLPLPARRIGLVVPDRIAKVSFVKFEEVPSRSDDRDQLVAWQIRKALPFRVEEAQLAYTPGMHGKGGESEFVVVVARRDIVEEYEGVCLAAGAYAGLVDLATFNLVNAALALAPKTGSDWLLLHVGRYDSTLVIMRGPNLIFFRNCPTLNESDVSDLVHQSAMYYEDRLEGQGMARTVLVVSADTPMASDSARQTLGERLGLKVERLASPKVTSSFNVTPTELDSLAAPIGLVMRERLSLT